MSMILPESFFFFFKGRKAVAGKTRKKKKKYVHFNDSRKSSVTRYQKSFVE